MNNFEHKEFKQHLKKIISYLDDISVGLNKALDAYLLVENKHTEKEDIARMIKTYKIRVKRGKKK